MQRFRSTSFAVVGGALLLVLTVSGVFGARGQAEAQPKPFGLDVAAFVLAMLDEQVDEEEQNEDTDPDTVEEDPDTLDEDVDEVDEVDEVDGQASNHGACVSAVARSDAVGGWQNNHGGAVSEAARYTCWGLEPVGSGGERDPEGDTSEGDELAAQDGDVLAMAGPGRGKSAAFERMGGRWSWSASDDTDEQAGPGEGQAKGKSSGPGASANGGSGKGSANKGRGHGHGR